MDRACGLRRPAKTRDLCYPNVVKRALACRRWQLPSDQLGGVASPFRWLSSRSRQGRATDRDDRSVFQHEAARVARTIDDAVFLTPPGSAAIFADSGEHLLVFSWVSPHVNEHQAAILRLNDLSVERAVVEDTLPFGIEHRP